MEKLRFNEEEYRGLKHRVLKLQSRVELDKGPEHETAVKLLTKLEKKLADYERTHEIPDFINSDIMSADSCFKTTSSFSFKDFWNNEESKEMKSAFSQNTESWEANQNFKWHVNFKEDKRYHEDTRTEEQLINDLGILYMIFGSTYCTVLNYHVFKIRFKRQEDKDNAFYRVLSDIYEDNICINKNVTIGFWPFRFGDTTCGDMEVSSKSSYDTDKYDNGCSLLYTTLVSELMAIWNDYFGDKSGTLLLTRRVVGLLESSQKQEIREVLNKEQRTKIIEEVEIGFKTNRMKEYYYNVAGTVHIPAFKSFDGLDTFLEYSGVVYQVETDGVYIWCQDEKEYKLLLDYKYNSRMRFYTLYVL